MTTSPPSTSRRYLMAIIFVLGVTLLTRTLNTIVIPKDLPSPVYSLAFLLSPVISVLAFYSVVRVALILGLREPMTTKALMREVFDQVALTIAIRVVIICVAGYAILSLSGVRFGGFYALLFFLAVYSIRLGLDHTYKEALVERGIATTKEIERETKDQGTLKSKALVAIGYRSGRYRIKAPYLQAAVVYFVPVGILSLISAIFSPESQGDAGVGLVSLLALSASAFLWSWVARRKIDTKNM